MTYKRKDIFKHYKPPESFITRDLTLTYVDTAHYWRITPDEFREKDTEVQAEMIAAMLCKQQIDAIIADERHREMLRQQERRR